MVRSRGFEPLMLFDTFSLSPNFRKEVIMDLFPRYSVQNNNRFYRWYWDNHKEPRICEETGQFLQNYWSGHVSHILPRGGYPQFAYDPININLLSFGAHQNWGDPSKKRNMKIWESNQLRIDTLRAMERAWSSHLRRDM